MYNSLTAHLSVIFRFIEY